MIKLIDGEMYAVTMDDNETYFCYYNEDMGIFEDADSDKTIDESSFEIRNIEEYK